MRQKHWDCFIAFALTFCGLGTVARADGLAEVATGGAACATGQAARGQAVSAQARGLYLTVQQAEAAATSRLIQLDQEVGRATQTLAAQHAPTDIAAEPLPGTIVSREGERDLLQQDLQVNAALQASYKAAAGKLPPRADADLVRTALLHWTALLRRRAMGSWQTVVPGLENDARCAGDVIADQLFLKYFDTLFDNPGSLASNRNAVIALSALARQSACLGTQQSANLASHLYWAFAELKSFLRLNGLERIVPAVAQAGAAPLLLFYDVEKHRGLWSPLARWFAENREHLIEGAITHRLPASWQGLWLYHRRTGQLVGFSPTLTPIDENHVDLPSFLDSIVRAENLADNTCTFSDMVMRGAGKFGYMCSGSACVKAAQQESRGGGGTSPSEPPSAGAETGGGAGFARVGYSAGVLKETTCKDSGPGGRGGPCAGAGAGGDILAALLNCIANLRMTADEKLLKCTAEATGRCSSPADRVTKRLEQAAFRGVPLGGCDISKGKKDAPPDPPGTLYTEKGIPLYPLVDYDKKAKEAEEKHKEAQKAIVTTDDMAKAEEELKRAKEADDKAKAELEKKKKETEESKKKSNKRCVEDTPDCGLNDCTAMSAQMQQTMACIQEALGASDPAPRVPGGGVFDPSPDAPENTSALTQCMNSINEQEPTESRCWTVKCGSNRATVVSGAGDCGCGAEVGPGGLSGGAVGAVLCGGSIDCGEDKRQDGCMCVAIGEALGPRPTPGGPDASTGPLIVSDPPTFSEVRFPFGTP